jgi:hypothetical protein
VRGEGEEMGLVGCGGRERMGVDGWMDGGGGVRRGWLAGDVEMIL